MKNLAHREKRDFSANVLRGLVSAKQFFVMIPNDLPPQDVVFDDEERYPSYPYCLVGLPVIHCCVPIWNHCLWGGSVKAVFALFTPDIRNVKCEITQLCSQLSHCSIFGGNGR
jgi:hypothetical protein